ncbi:MAG: uncharacterized membrane protein (UPF0127 family), partial [Ilumatobacter sp.]
NHGDSVFGQIDSDVSENRGLSRARCHLPKRKSGTASHVADRTLLRRPGPCSHPNTTPSITSEHDTEPRTLGPPRHGLTFSAFKERVRSGMMSVMAWLVSDARVLASAELAETRAARRKGLLGRSSLDGALVIRPCRGVHTIGMKFPIDVAFIDEDGVVVKMLQMARHRVGIPVFSACTVIEANAGAFARWGVSVGDVIEVREE